MSENTAIEWADHTFNPWIGCTKISPACDHCYAERWDSRLHGGEHWGAGAPRRRTSASNWAQPLKWNRQAAANGTRYRVFCASLADVFDNEVPVQWRLDLLDLIRMTPHLDWLLLTKRIGAAAARIGECASLAPFQGNDALAMWLWFWSEDGDAPPNVWLGATVVNQEEVDRDLPKLLGTPAAVRFLSCEPLLGSLDVTVFLKRGDHGMRAQDPMAAALLAEGEATGHAWVRPAIDWVIAGGESGPQARPSHPDWFRSLRDQCVAAGVPFLFKQWGEWAPDCIHDGPACVETPRPTPGKPGCMFRCGKKRAGRALDGRTWDQFPEPAA